MPNKRGNQGYGKVELIRQNFDKFSPVFWELMEVYSTSGDPDKERLFITEFNKLQAKMIPQEVGGINGEAIQIQWLSSPTNQDSGLQDSTTPQNAG